MRRVAFGAQLTREPQPPTAPNNLWSPLPGKGAIHGGFRALGFDPYSWLRLHPAAASAVAGASVGGAGVGPPARAPAVAAS